MEERSIVQDAVLKFYWREQRPPTYDECEAEIAARCVWDIDRAGVLLMGVLCRKEVDYKNSIPGFLPQIIGQNIVDKADDIEHVYSEMNKSVASYAQLINDLAATVKVIRAQQQDGTLNVDGFEYSLFQAQISILTERLTEPEGELVFSWLGWLAGQSKLFADANFRDDYLERIDANLLRRTWPLVEQFMATIGTTTPEERAEACYEMAVFAIGETVSEIREEQRS